MYGRSRSALQVDLFCICIDICMYSSRHAAERVQQEALLLWLTAACCLHLRGGPNEKSRLVSKSTAPESQAEKQAGSKFQMIFLICAEIGCVKIWVCPSALTSDTADTNMQLYFERKNGTQKYQDCIFSQVHVPCGRHCVGYCEFRFLMPKNDKNGPVSSILGAHKMCHFPHNRFLM